MYLARVHTSYNLIAVLGPTACGKTRLAARLAYDLHTDVISADSRQVYRRMNIGTGKDYNEYVVNGSQVPYHLIDIEEPGEKYHVHRFVKDFFEVFEALNALGKVPVLCGGTGLYLDAVLRDLSFTAVPNNRELRESIGHKTRDELLELFIRMPATAFTPKADTSTAKRLIRAIEISEYLLHSDFAPPVKQAVSPLIFGLDLPVALRNERIEQRLKKRLNSGMIEEVKMLLKSGITKEQLVYYGLEYKFVALYLSGELSYEALVELLAIAIRQFAKRQMTYFRKMEKDGHAIHWIDARADTDEQLAEIKNMLRHEKAR
jgi:tRNA dimethylallyltransferase